MDFFLSKLRGMLPLQMWEALTTRFRKGPIDSVEVLADFVQTRSAYVAQTSLYGYLKNRMGIKYPEMFADETMAVSINLAKWRTYGSCLTDLAIFAAAMVGAANRLSDQQSSELARLCFERAVSESFDDDEAEKLSVEIAEAFARRLAKVDWTKAAVGENAFLNSPADLVRFAPIADELKELDVDIVINSTRFRWKDIRSQLKERINPDAISAGYLKTSRLNSDR